MIENKKDKFIIRIYLFYIKNSKNSENHHLNYNLNNDIVTQKELFHDKIKALR